MSDDIKAIPGILKFHCSLCDEYAEWELIGRIGSKYLFTALNHQHHLPVVIALDSYDVSSAIKEMQKLEVK